MAKINMPTRSDTYKFRKEILKIIKSYPGIDSKTITSTLNVNRKKVMNALARMEQKDYISGARSITTKSLKRYYSINDGAFKKLDREYKMAEFEPDTLEMEDSSLENVQNPRITSPMIEKIISPLFEHEDITNVKVSSINIAINDVKSQSHTIEVSMYQAKDLFKKLKLIPGIDE